jgi:hypothetical protein
LGLLIAVLVVAVTFTCAQRATAVVNTANATLIPYNLAAGGFSPAIMPVANQPVLLMGTCTTPNYRGVGHVSLLRIAGTGGFIEWAGINSTNLGTITHGFSATTGTNIVAIDFANQVHVQVLNPDKIRVHNGANAARSGFFTLIW